MSKITVQEAITDHFITYGLPADGGYEETWVPLKFGFLTFYIYNSEARKSAVKLHDIHHVITQYEPTPRGEAEISAWELAAGIYNKHFARIINLGGLFYGAYIYPKTTFRAYVRGKYSSTLYSQNYSASLLEQSVESLKKRLLPQFEQSPQRTHYIQYGLLVCFVSLPALLLLFGLGLLVSNYI